MVVQAASYKILYVLKTNNLKKNYSMVGIGAQYPGRLLRKFFQMNLMDLLLFGTQVMIITYFHLPSN